MDSEKLLDWLAGGKRSIEIRNGRIPNTIIFRFTDEIAPGKMFSRELALDKLRPERSADLTSRVMDRWDRAIEAATQP